MRGRDISLRPAPLDEFFFSGYGRPVFFLSDFFCGVRAIISASYLPGTWSSFFYIILPPLWRLHSRYSSPNSTDGSFLLVSIKEETQPMGAWGCSPLELPSAYPPHAANEVPFIKHTAKYEIVYLSLLPRRIRSSFLGGILWRLRQSNQIFLASFKEA